MENPYNLTLRASLFAELGINRGMLLAAENHKLSHVQRKKSNLTQLHRNFKTKKEFFAEGKLRSILIYYLPKVR